MRIKKLNSAQMKGLFFVWLLCLLSIFIAFSNYCRIPLSGISDFIKYSIHFIILCSSLIGLFALVATSRFVFTVLGPPLLLFSLASAVSLFFYNMTITSEIIEVVLKTDWSVSKEFVGPYMVVVIGVVLSAIFLIIRYRYRLGAFSLKCNLSIIIISVLLILPAVVINNKRNNTFVNRAPYSLISASREYLMTVKASQMPRQLIAEDADYVGEDSLLVILVLGESLRNDHLSFNGYYRNTTPRLSQRSIYSFSQNRSLSTYTAASIPQILTRADAQHLNRAFDEESLLSICKRVGFRTFWVANQVPDYTYASIAKSCDVYFNYSAKTSTYSDVVSTDGNILNELDLYLDSSEGRPKLLVLHTMGSHWYYNYRCPEHLRQYYPITNSRSFANNSSEQMINSYDNSVFFTDYFIDEVIKNVASRNAILIYVSDHGESLGEDGKWLHAFEHETLYDAACFVWMSQKYKSLHPFETALQDNCKKASNTSAIFHTLLQAACIESEVVDYRKSLLSEHYEE